QRFPFSLKHASQIANLRIGDEVEGLVLGKIKGGIFVEISNIRVFVSGYYLGSDRLEQLAPNDTIVLKCVSVDTYKKVTIFHPKRDEEALQPESVIDDEIIGYTLDFYYMTAIKRFTSHLQDTTAKIEELIKQANDAPSEITGQRRSSRRGGLTAGDYFVSLLNQHKIPSTYRNIRVLLGFLWKQPYRNLLLQQLTEIQLSDTDHETAHILCRTARELIKGEAGTDVLASYAIGIVTLVYREASDINLVTDAIEPLLYAYELDKSLDAETALFILYTELGNMTLCRRWLHCIITRLTGNLGWLLKLPAPLELEVPDYSRLFPPSIPGLCQKVSELAKEVKEINALIQKGKVRDAKRELKDRWTKARQADIEIITLDLNLALCDIILKDFQGALKYLEGAGESLSKAKYRTLLPVARESYYQLAMYIHYHLGNFDQLQTFAGERFQQGAEQWLETWLGYVFFASGNYALSKALICRKKLPAHPIPENSMQQEHILLYLYWETQEEAFKRGVQLLQETLFRSYCIGEYSRSKNRASVWLQSTQHIRLFPDPQNRSFKQLARIAHELDTPDYILKEYYKDPNLQVELRDWEFASSLIDLTLYKLESLAEERATGPVSEGESGDRPEPVALKDAQKILKEYFRRQPSRESSNQPSINVSQFYSSLGLKEPFQRFKNEHSGVDWQEVEEDRNKIETKKEIIERWMKSPYERALIGRKVVALLTTSPVLAQTYWDRQELRDQIWQALDLCMDHGSLLSLLERFPQNGLDLSMDALEDIVFHLLNLGWNHFALDLLHRKRNSTLKQHEHKYLEALQALSDSEDSTVSKAIIPLLLARSSQRDFAFYTDSHVERVSAIQAFEFLVNYPASRRVSMMFLLGELYQIERCNEQTSKLYTRMIAELGNEERLRAFFCFLRLHILQPTVPFPSHLLPQNQKPFTSLLTILVKTADMTPKTGGVLHIAALIGRLQSVMEFFPPKREWHSAYISQLEAILYLLSQIPAEGEIFIHLYKSLVGTDPLDDWSGEDVRTILSLFTDYALVRNLADQIKDTVDLTLAATITRLEVSVGKQGQGRQNN
ncbi:MAG TPA: hypothetical protein VN207_09170, partial [Ktedonobacteraceae bacterium]|nr:hypothetical protein [Ktedonobacteraceae bacterium]